jgi:DNA-binding transcriptional MerR regulator
MAPALTIGQLAQATGVSAKTIRYYEEVGVLPCPARTAAGYRQYAQDVVDQLLFIRRARALGLPLQQVKALTEVLNDGSRGTLRPRLRLLVRVQLSAVQQQITELQLLERRLEQVLQRSTTPRATNQTGVCDCLETEIRPVGTIKPANVRRERSG